MYLKIPVFLPKLLGLLWQIMQAKLRGPICPSQFLSDLARYWNSPGDDSDDFHNEIENWFWWCWNANSVDTGGMVRYLPPTLHLFLAHCKLFDTSRPVRSFLFLPLVSHMRCFASYLSISMPSANSVDIGEPCAPVYSSRTLKLNPKPFRHDAHIRFNACVNKYCASFSYYLLSVCDCCFVADNRQGAAEPFAFGFGSSYHFCLMIKSSVSLEIVS